jgi:hypothetical protein
MNVERDNVVGTETHNGPDDLGAESRWRQDSAPSRTGPAAHPAFYTMGTSSFPEVKRQGRVVDHPTPSRTEVKESRAVPLLPFWDFVTCSRVNLTFTIIAL